MSSQGSNRKRTLRIFIVLVVIFVILGIAIRKYLNSSQVASQVASRLEAVYGGPVRVGEVKVGLFRSSLARVQLFEKGESASGKPWATIDVVEADVSLLSLLHDSFSPKTVKLIGPAITLRFDKEGRLLTQFPDWSAGNPGNPIAVPNLSMERGRITFQKEA